VNHRYTCNACGRQVQVSVSSAVTRARCGSCNIVTTLLRHQCGSCKMPLLTQVYSGIRSVRCPTCRHIEKLASINPATLSKPVQAARSNPKTTTHEDRLNFGGQTPPARDANDFEDICEEFLRANGRPSAQRTRLSRDSGVDVLGDELITQAKFLSNGKVGPDIIRQIAGSRQEYNKKEAYVFSWYPGYTPDAIKTAETTSRSRPCRLLFRRHSASRTSMVSTRSRN